MGVGLCECGWLWVWVWFYVGVSVGVVLFVCVCGWGWVGEWIELWLAWLLLFLVTHHNATQPKTPRTQLRFKLVEEEIEVKKRSAASSSRRRWVRVCGSLSPSLSVFVCIIHMYVFIDGLTPLSHTQQTHADATKPNENQRSSSGSSSGSSSRSRAQAGGGGGEERGGQAAGEASPLSPEEEARLKVSF